MNTQVVAVDPELLDGAVRALEQAVPALQHLREIQEMLKAHAPWTTGSIKARVAQLILMTQPQPDPTALCTPQDTLCHRCMNDVTKCDKTWVRAEDLTPSTETSEA